MKTGLDPRGAKDALDPDFLEAIADIAYQAGKQNYYGGDSRQDKQDFIDWSREFAAHHRDNTWEETDYMETIEAFTEAKMNLSWKDKQTPRRQAQ